MQTMGKDFSFSLSFSLSFLPIFKALKNTLDKKQKIELLKQREGRYEDS